MLFNSEGKAVQKDQAKRSEFLESLRSQVTIVTDKDVKAGYDSKYIDSVRENLLKT